MDAIWNNVMLTSIIVFVITIVIVHFGGVYTHKIWQQVVVVLALASITFIIIGAIGTIWCN